MERRWASSLWALVLALCFVKSFGGEDLSYPRHVHLSLGDDVTQMVVTWTTFSPTNFTVVEYGPDGLTLDASGNSNVFVDGGSEHRTYYIHKVVLKGLQPGQKYLYHCGSPDAGWSDLFYFRAMRNDSAFSPRLAIYGDLGNVNSQSLADLQEDTQRGLYDAILHVGDMAYDMDSDNGRYGDSFMDQIQPIAAYVPYMTCPGNHEQAYNFSNYKSRFSMPSGDRQNIFYSFDVGPAHIISISTEVFFFLEYGIKQIFVQEEWLKQDLAIANLPENRAKHPWIIVMGHRPMYCSNTDGDDCTHYESLIRFALENLLYQNGVDILLWAHEHTYERMFPVYNRKVCNGSVDEPYVNPGAPVHIVTGSAGCQEGPDDFDNTPPPWSAFRTRDYGYTRMNIYNATHLYFEQVSINQGGKVVDKATIVKSTHGAGTYNCV